MRIHSLTHPAATQSAGGPRRARWRGAAWRTLLPLALLLAPLLGALLAPGEARAQRTPPPRSGLVAATVDQILENPEAYAGRNVRVNGEIEAAVGPRAFTIQDRDPLFDDGLLVLSQRPLRAVPTWPENARSQDAALLGDHVASVRGTVRLMDLRSLERDLDVDLDDRLFAGGERRPVVVADWVDVAARARDTTVDAILDEPERFVGQVVTVYGELNREYGLRAFTIEDGDLLFDDALLVVTPVPVRALPAWRLPAVDERDVRVTGTVRRLDVPGLERTLGIDLDDELFAGWDGRPVVVATAIDGLTLAGPPLYGVPPARDAAGAADASDELTAADLADDPGAYFDRSIRLRGEVTDVLTRRALVLDDRVLVLTRTAIPAEIRARAGRSGAGPGGAITVHGTARAFDRAALEQELGIDLGSQVWHAWRDRTVVVASSLSPAATPQR
jgi:hypothetical protein